MDKRYQVFVSSTYEDLQDERKEVMQALLELDCIPAGMELFPASNDDQWTLIQRVIDDCDYYLLIIGGRYGSTNENGISYTQMEFEYALESGKPIISFLPKDPSQIPAGKCDNEPEKKEKLEKFKQLAKKKLIKYWENPENLGSVVSRSMVRLIKDFPAEGWVKSNSIVDESSLQEISRLQKENNELKLRLQAVATEPPEGSANFSKGENTVEIFFSLRAFDVCAGEYCKLNSSLEFTWNNLFKAIAPNMINECTEQDMIDALDELLAQYLYIIRRNPRFHGFEDLDNFHISQESFNLIRVQFKALGMICLTPKRKDGRFAQTYWSLTPYGDYIMTQLLAIRQ